MIEDEDAATVLHAAAHAVHADAEATVAKGEGLYALMTGVGVGAALLGAAFLVLATKAHPPTTEGAPAAATSTPGSSPGAMTKAERAFVSRPEFVSAELKGRLVADPDGRIKFDDGNVFAPSKRDPVSGRATQDRDVVFNVGPYIGSLAFCNAIPGSESSLLFYCYAIDRDGNLIDLETTQTKRVQP
jgi:hypothetical protein